MKIRQDIKNSITIIENFDISAGDTIRYDISTSNLYFDISKQHYPIHMRYNQSTQWSNYSKICGRALPFPSPPPPFPSPPPHFPFPSPAFPFPYPPFTPRPLSRLGGLGERSSSPSGSERSPAAKGFLVLLEL